MFDWLEFDKNVKKEYEEQTERLNAYITEFLRKNSQIRELPIFDEPSQETLDRILSMEIPAKGRIPWMSVTNWSKMFLNNQCLYNTPDSSLSLHLRFRLIHWREAY